LRKKPVKKTAAKKAEETEMPAKPKKVSFVSDKHKRRPRSNTGWLVVAVVILLFVILIGGAWYQTQQIGEESKQVATGIKEEVTSEVDQLKQKLQSLTEEFEKQKEEKAEPVYKEYLNQQLGITFKYPEELGGVNEEVDVQEPVEEGGVEEKALQITFSGNSDIWLVAATSAYDSDDISVYTGDEENLAELCDEPLAVSEEGYCDLIGLVGQQTVEQVYSISDDTGLANTIKTVPINLTSGEYAGLTFNVGLGTPPVSNRNLFAPPAKEDQVDALDQFFRDLIKKEGLSLVVQENLDNFKTILASLQIL